MKGVVNLFLGGGCMVWGIVLMEGASADDTVMTAAGAGLILFGLYRLIVMLFDIGP